jgi:hypothetical protein
VNPLPGVPIQEDGVEFRAVTSFFLVPRTSIATDRLSLARSLPQWAGLEPGSDETPFLLTGIPPGSYDLYPVFQLGGGDTPRASSEYLLAYREEVVTSRTEVNVIDRDIEDLRIVLQPNGAISGRVVITGDGGGIDPGLLSVRLDPGRLLPTHTSAFGVPDELKLLQPVDPDSGAFAFQGLPQGSYAAAVAGLPADAYVADMRLGALSIMQGGRFDVSPGLGLPLEIRIAPDGALVEGTVLDRNREGVPRAGVVLVPDAPNRNNRTLYRRLTADMSGRFVLRGVAPGRYKAFSWPELPEGGAEEYPPFLAQFELKGQSLAVRAGETQTVSLQVIPARSD